MVAICQRTLGKIRLLKDTPFLNNESNEILSLASDESTAWLLPSFTSMATTRLYILVRQFTLDLFVQLYTTKCVSYIQLDNYNCRAKSNGMHWGFPWFKSRLIVNSRVAIGMVSPYISSSTTSSMNYYSSSGN